MDTHTLVKTQVEDAERWISQLKNDGFPISAAFWAKRADQDRWSFYLATPTLEETGTLKAIRRVLHALGAMGEVSFRGSDVLMLVNEKDRFVQDVLDFQKRFPELARKKLKGQRLGGAIVDVFIYPIGEVPITLYGLVFREPIGISQLSFEEFKTPLWVEVGGTGGSTRYPAETGNNWLVAAPEGSTFESDEYGRKELVWNLRGMQKKSDANEVMALADLGLHGFRLLSEPASLKTAPLK